jgi:hypothetical protein
MHTYSDFFFQPVRVPEFPTEKSAHICHSSADALHVPTLRLKTSLSLQVDTLFEKDKLYTHTYTHTHTHIRGTSLMKFEVLREAKISYCGLANYDMCSLVGW